MCAPPEDCAAALTTKESIVELPSLGRHVRLGELAGDDFERTSATHAAGFDQGKIQTSQDKGQLLVAVELLWDEKSADSPVADDVALHDSAVAGQEDGVVASGKLDELAVVLSILPIGVVAGSPEPASQAAKHGIADEAGRRRGIGRHTNQYNKQSRYAKPAVQCLINDPKVLQYRG